MLKIIRFIPTIKNYLKWKKIIKQNKKELEKRRFSINWIYQLGLTIELKEEDIVDINYMKKTIDELDYNSTKQEVQEFQLSVMIENYKNIRIAEGLQKHNDFFLTTGLRELIVDEFEIEDLDEFGYAYLVYLSYEIATGFKWTFLIDILFTFSVLVYLFFKSIKNNI